MRSPEGVSLKGRPIRTVFFHIRARIGEVNCESFFHRRNRATFNIHLDKVEFDRFDAVLCRARRGHYRSSSRGLAPAREAGASDNRYTPRSTPRMLSLVTGCTDQNAGSSVTSEAVARGRYSQVNLDVLDNSRFGPLRIDGAPSVLLEQSGY